MTDAPPAWDPQQYSRFDAERDRAALDLLLRLPGDLDPREIWDLGCGAGQHAAMLKRRHPGATVHGLDSSAEMLARARALGTDVDWQQGDIADWSPEAPADLILANASLHWLPDHSSLLRRLAEALVPGGALAIQMPMAHETRHHTLLRAVAAEGPWAAPLAGVEAIAPLLSPEAYYEVLASDRLEIAMELEADRMQGLLLDPEEFRSELAVIREERKQTREDPPYGLLMESIEATAFTAHPYHWPIIGWMTDLETIEVEDVRRYYRDFYRPNNAVLIVVGDARPEQVVELAERHFGRIERGPEIPPLKVREPEQRGERMTSIRKAVQLPGLVLAYRSPASIAYEAKVLNVIEFLLFHGRSSRLYQRLVYREQLAADLGGGVQFRKDPSLFTLRATARPGVEVARLQDAIEDELRRLCREPVSPEELAKARRAIEADYLFSQESHYELAHNLGAEECRSSWRDYAAYLGENLRVGAEEIQAVANATFKDSARTIGRLIPDSRAAGSAEESA